MQKQQQQTRQQLLFFFLGWKEGGRTRFRGGGLNPGWTAGEPGSLYPGGFWRTGFNGGSDISLVQNYDTLGWEDEN